MIWLGLLCLTVSWEFIAGVFIEPQPTPAFIFCLVGVLCFGFALWNATHASDPKQCLAATFVNALMILVSITVCEFLFLRLYFWIAPHYHAVPLLSAPLEILLKAVGHETARHGEFIYIQTFKSVLPVSITFEKLGAPALCSFFLTGWLTAVWLHEKHWARLLIEFGAIIGGFAVFRIIALILLFADSDHLALFWNPVWIGISFLPLIAILAYFYPMPNIQGFLGLPTISLRKSDLRHYGVMSICFLFIVVLLSTEDPGTEKSGKILIDEVHSNWEWTTIPFDKERYGKQTTYNYYCFKTWLDHYYDVSANTNKALTREFLNPYTTLIIKTPTSAFSETELAAIQAFVRDGGGLFLIGDHTNLYGMTTYINPVSELFGITFLPDDTFQLTTGAPTFYQPPHLFAHPTVHHIPNFGFMTSCTIAAPLLRSRTIMLGAQLGRENADYSHLNFFGNITADINDEYGLFIQATARKYGKGRVVAFSDSTVFSNFSMFFEGKPELAIGIMEFLNRANSRVYNIVTLILLIGAVLGLLWGLLQFRRAAVSFPVSLTRIGLVLACTILIGNGLSTRMNAFNYRKPQPHTNYTRINFDQSISEYRLPALIESKSVDPEFCYDAFYTAVQRLGHYPALTASMKSATETGEVLVVINMQRRLEADELSHIERFLLKGGKLLVLENSEAPTYYMQQFQRFSQQESENIAVPIEFQTPEKFRIVKTKVGNGNFVQVFGATQLSRLFMGPTHSNPTEEQKLKYRLAYFLFQEVLKVST